MKIFYIDYENVNSQGLKGVRLLDEDAQVNILYSKKADNVKFDALSELMKSKAEIHLLPVHVGTPNALDFQLVTLLFLNYKAENLYYIISKDSGYDCCIKTAEENGAPGVRRFYDIATALREGSKQVAKPQQARSRQSDPKQGDQQTGSQLAGPQQASSQQTALQQVGDAQMPAQMPAPLPALSQEPSPGQVLSNPAPTDDAYIRADLTPAADVPVSADLTPADGPQISAGLTWADDAQGPADRAEFPVQNPDAEPADLPAPAQPQGELSQEASNLLSSADMSEGPDALQEIVFAEVKEEGDTYGAVLSREEETEQAHRSRRRRRSSRKPSSPAESAPSPVHDETPSEENAPESDHAEKPKAGRRRSRSKGTRSAGSGAEPQIREEDATVRTAEVQAAPAEKQEADPVSSPSGFPAKKVREVLNRRTGFVPDDRQTSLIRDVLQKAKNKQQFYTLMVRKFGQKEGLALYHTIRCAYNDLVAIESN